MLVLKFGGTSVASSEAILQVKEIISQLEEHQNKILIVCSAFGGFTDRLLAIGARAAGQEEAYSESIEQLIDDENKILNDLFESIPDALNQEIQKRRENLKSLYKGVFLTKEFSARTKDCVVSYGELNSSQTIHFYLAESNIGNSWLDPRDLIKTDDTFGQAKVNFKDTEAALNKSINGQGIYITGGFVGSNSSNETTTLGRGGSDYTAAIIAAISDADELQIWTDVNGVMTADPRKVKNAFSLSSLTYSEALELSHFGAKVIYPPTIQPVLKKNIALRIKIHLIRHLSEPEFRKIMKKVLPL